MTIRIDSLPFDGLPRGARRYTQLRAPCDPRRARATTKKVILEELHVGTEGVFADAGFAEVSRPTRRRVVMRVDF
jgi:hypothetical protein